MNEHEVQRTRRRPRGFVVRRLMRIIARILVAAWQPIRTDVRALIQERQLFVGIAFLIIGLLSFASDHYCDGNTSAYYSCTRPATYYFYPWWAILLVLVGSFGVLLWYTKRSGQRSSS